MKQFEINQIILCIEFRGHAKTALGDIVGAIQDFNKVIELEPNNSDAFSSRGSAKEKIGDTQGAN